MHHVTGIDDEMYVVLMRDSMAGEISRMIAEGSTNTSAQP